MRYLVPLISLVFLISSSLFAGEVSLELSQKLEGISSDSKIPVVISMEEPGNSQIRKALSLEQIDKRSARYQYVLNELKRNSADIQSGIIEYLNNLEREDKAENIKSHWIINAITADIMASEIKNIASRSDVYEVFQLPHLTLITPETENYSPKITQAQSVGANLITVGADSAWEMGYDGTGSLICSFDTGVNGIHPALSERWRGRDGDTSAAWFDPINQSPYPEDYGYESHGTKTMGILVGYDSGQDRHFGVAPGAEWISAAVIDILGASIIDAFEWAANPDGDPNTIDDVPDVINHSWGIFNSSVGCHDYYWEMIDNTEALGIVNIFAAGNEGSQGAMTIRNPANRATDSLNCFAVGWTNVGGTSINSNSSRGPSDCDTTIIKPNVVAPGDGYLSSAGSAGIGGCYGSSFSAPHVAGAVAILRQYAPNATVDEVKEAILESCRPVTGNPLPNNNEGYGIIWIPDAISALAPDTDPDLRIYSFDHETIEPGDTVVGYVMIKNFGGAIDSVYATANGSNGGIDILIDGFYFGYIDEGDTAQSDVQFEAVISDTVSYGQVLTVHFELLGKGGYNFPCMLYIKVGEDPPPAFYTHENDLIQFTISNFGQYGFAGGSFYPLGYSGFKFNDPVRNDLFEGSFIVGTDSNRVSDGIRNIVLEPDNDFAVSPDGELVSIIPGERADIETYSAFNDSRAENPIGLEIEQSSLSWLESPNENFVIFEYIIKNISGSDLNNIFAGLFMDWDLYFNRIDSAGGDAATDLGYIFHQSYWDPVNSQMVPAKYRGGCVISEGGLYSHSLFKFIDTDSLYPISEVEKYLALSSGTYDHTQNLYTNLAHVVSTGPIDLLADQADTIAFAVVASESEVGLIDAAIQAKNIYTGTTDIEIIDNPTLPENFTLSQNFPNPFNPSTTIEFALKTQSSVELAVYNILGEQVTVLVRDELDAGTYRVKWDGHDSNGAKTASGIYFYRLKTDSEYSVRKMLLLK